MRSLPGLILSRYSSTTTPNIARRLTNKPTIRMATQLAQLPEVERLSPACIRILGGNPGKFTLQGTNTYLVGTGPKRLLIDTGEGRPSWIAALARTLADEGARVESALITHRHHDHVGGLSQLLEQFPDTVVYKADPSETQKEISDGQTFAVDGATLTAVHTPGHTEDHMAFVLKEEDALFTGDNILGHGTAVFEDLPTYLSSLALMKTLVAGRGYPGHGPVVEKTQDKISEYIRHRQQREGQVLQVMNGSPEPNEAREVAAQAGEWTLMEIVEVIYRDVPKNLHLPAAGGVVQILSKLRDEDKVIYDESTDRWRLKQDRSSL